VNYKHLATIATLLTLATLPALADNGKRVGELGRFEGDRDLNLFQVEPSIINERFYTSGKAERTQYVGNVLPAGAPIPDSDAPTPVQKSTDPAKTSAPGKTTAPIKSESETTTESASKTESTIKTDSTGKTEATAKADAKGKKQSSLRRLSGERYYTSGAAERHQHIGNTLPEGAPIPDNE
jgi:hypothetical protein